MLSYISKKQERFNAFLYDVQWSRNIKCINEHRDKGCFSIELQACFNYKEILPNRYFQRVLSCNYQKQSYYEKIKHLKIFVLSRHVT